MNRFLIAAAAVAAVAVPSTATASSPYISVGTAKLLTDRIQHQLERQSPKTRYTRGKCTRISRAHVDCKIAGRKTVDGIPEVTRYVSHARATKGGYAASTTSSGPERDRPAHPVHD